MTDIEKSEIIGAASETNQNKSNENDANLPSINEELARIFPDSAAIFLNESAKRGRGRPRKYPVKQKVPGRSRGRPRIHPVTNKDKEKVPGRGRGRPRKNPAVVPSSEKVPGRGRGRPRKNAASSSNSDKPVSGRPRGRPRIYPISQTTDAIKEKVKRERGRPRIYPIKSSTNSTSVRKVGRPKQNPEDHEARGGMKIKRSLETDFNELDLNLRKKPRLSYVDDDIDMIDEDDEYSDIEQFNANSTKHMNDNDSESGFESGESPVIVKRGRGRPRKNQIIVSRRGRPRDYENLSINMTRSLCVSLERLDSQTLSIVNSPISHLPVLKRKKGRPRKNSYPSRGRPKKHPVVLDTEVKMPSGRKRGRPKGSERKRKYMGTSSVEENIAVPAELSDLNDDINVTNEVTNVPSDEVKTVMNDAVKETVTSMCDKVVTNSTASEDFIDLPID